MVQRSLYIKDHAVKEVTDKLDQKEAIIGEYQEKAKVAIEELKQAQDSIKELKQEKEESLKQLEESRSTNENNQLLINEYKEKTDTLSSLVNGYKGYADESRCVKNLDEQKNVLNHRLRNCMVKQKIKKKKLKSYMNK